MNPTIYSVNMYKSEHTDFILSPLSDILEEGFLACQAVGDGIESYPLCDYVLQSLFLKLTGAQEQKLKCICWDLATKDYDYRYEYLNRKNYGECSNYDSKNGIFKDLISIILKRDSTFDPTGTLRADLSAYLPKLSKMYDGSLMSEWQASEYFYYKSSFLSNLSASQIGQSQQNKGGNTTYSLFQSTVKDIYEDVVYRHRNRCAHNTLSYQINKPDLSFLASDDALKHNYFLRFALILVIDKVFVVLFKKYLSLQSEY